MKSQFKVSSTLPRRLEDLGVAPAAVLRRAGLPMALFSQDKIAVTTEEFFRLHQAISEVSQDPAIGLKLGTETRVERYDPVLIAALHSRSFRDALQRLSRYKVLTCPEEIQLVERGAEGAVRFLWLLAHEVEPALLVDVCFAWILSIARRGTDRPVQPRRVELQRAEAHRQMYETYFGCPVKFRARRNAIVFSRADLDLPFITHNADLLAVIAPQLEAQLSAQLALRSTAEKVKSTLKRLIAGQRPSMEDVARELGLSTRTLQRRLAEEGRTFQQALQEARRELAHHYLLHSSMELNEAAYLLGFEHANSFFRAFHEWEGTSPGQWRAEHESSQASSDDARSASLPQSISVH